MAVLRSNMDNNSGNISRIEEELKGADDRSGTDLLCVSQHIGNCGMMGEVDDHIRIHPAQFFKGLGDIILAVDADPTNDLRTQNMVDQFAHGAVGAAEYSSHTSIPSFLISA